MIATHPGQIWTEAGGIFCTDLFQQSGQDWWWFCGSFLVLATTSETRDTWYRTVTWYRKIAARQSETEQPWTTQAPQRTPDAGPDQQRVQWLTSTSSAPANTQTPRQEEHSVYTRSTPVILSRLTQSFPRTVRDWSHLRTAIISATSFQSFWNQLGGSLHNLQPKSPLQSNGHEPSSL